MVFPLTTAYATSSVKELQYLVQDEVSENPGIEDGEEEVPQESLNDAVGAKASTAVTSNP